MILTVVVSSFFPLLTLDTSLFFSHSPLGIFLMTPVTPILLYFLIQSSWPHKIQYISLSTFFVALFINFTEKFFILINMLSLTLYSSMSRWKTGDSKLFLFPFYFYFYFYFSFSFQITSLSILRTIIRVTRSCGHTSVTSDDMITSHKIHRKT